MLVSALLLGCASPPSGSRLAPCWEGWSAEADLEAITAFQLDLTGAPHRYPKLYERLDYLDAYCGAANRAMDVQAPDETPQPWWRRLLRGQR